MRFRDLGPLTIEVVGRDRAVGGSRLESVLSVLLVAVDTVVPVDALIDAVWGADPPPRVSGSLDTLIWRLRRILEPERPARSPSTILLTEDLGYRLRIPPGTVDSALFADAAREAVAHQDSGDLETVLTVSGEALAMWRGDPYQGVLDTGWLEPVRARLSELRVQVHGQRIEALLGSGQPERAVIELGPLLTAYPFHEKLWGQLMLGLYRSGRQAEALDAFRRAQRLIDDELGVQPGPELREMQRRILDHDANLHDAGTATPTVRPVIRLPRRRVQLVGRDADLTAVSDALDARQIVTIAGPMGCGKTALATAVAERVSGAFRDGVWFVDLTEATDLAGVASRIAGGLGADIPADVDLLTALSDFVADRHLLLVLDNCEQVVAAAADVVEELTAEAPAVSILLTSREPLGIAAEWEYRLRPLPIPAAGSDLAANPAVALFVQRISNLGRVIDLAGPDGPMIAQICTATDGLPLSLELAAARVRSLELHEIAASLEKSPGALAGHTGRRTDPKRRISLRDGVESSFQMATADEQVVHRRLSVLPGGMTPAAASAVCVDSAIAADLVADLVGGLVYRSLLEVSPPSRPGGPSHYRQLVPIRAHASEMLTASGEAQQTSRARDRWVIETVAAGARIGRPGQAAFYDLLDDNHSTITATLEERCRAFPIEDDILLTVAGLAQYWSDRERSVDARDFLQLAARAALFGAPPDTEGLPTATTFAAAAASVSYGNSLAYDQQMPAAMPWLRSALPLLTDPDPGRLREAAELLILTAACVWVGDDWAFARAIALQALQHGERLKDPQVLLTARAIAAAADIVVGDPADAVAEATAVLAENAVIGNGLAAVMGAATLAIATVSNGDPVGGLHWSTETLRAQRSIGIRDMADAFETRGALNLGAGRYEDAVRCYAAAASHNRRVGRGFPRAPSTTERLEQLQARLPATDYRRAWAGGERLDLSELAGDWL